MIALLWRTALAAHVGGGCPCASFWPSCPPHWNRTRGNAGLTGRPFDEYDMRQLMASPDRRI
ncbi:MAG: hypothetical protein ACOYMG_13150 [Candidatus Methylumidiphilus sp.]